MGRPFDLWSYLFSSLKTMSTSMLMWILFIPLRKNNLFTGTILFKREERSSFLPRRRFAGLLDSSNKFGKSLARDPVFWKEAFGLTIFPKKCGLFSSAKAKLPKLKNKQASVTKEIPFTIILTPLKNCS